MRPSASFSPAALEQLAEELPDEEQAPVTRRGATGLPKMSGSVVLETTKGELRRLAGEGFTGGEARGPR